MGSLCPVSQAPISVSLPPRRASRHCPRVTLSPSAANSALMSEGRDESCCDELAWGGLGQGDPGPGSAEARVRVISGWGRVRQGTGLVS